MRTLKRLDNKEGTREAMKTSELAEGPAVHEWTGPTGVKFRDVREPSGMYYHDTTPRAVIDQLERARAYNLRIRLFTGNRETGKEWFAEHDVCGRVGRSMGPIRIPLLIHNSQSRGGGAILTDCIVRLFVDGKEVYRHPHYKEPKFTVREIAGAATCGKINLRADGYTHAVDIDGKNHANFKSLVQAERWIAFMRGERFSK